MTQASTNSHARTHHPACRTSNDLSPCTRTLPPKRTTKTRPFATTAASRWRPMPTSTSTKTPAAPTSQVGPPAAPTATVPSPPTPSHRTSTESRFPNTGGRPCSSFRAKLKASNESARRLRVQIHNAITPIIGVSAVVLECKNPDVIRKHPVVDRERKPR